MTRTEYNQLLSQLPEAVRKKYGFNEPFDYSPYKCIHTDEYDYYPELNTCIINERPIIWEDNNPWVTPENPKILKEFKELARCNDTTPRMHVVELMPNAQKIKCYSPAEIEPHISNLKRKNCTSFITINDEKIYYNPDNIDLPNKPEIIKLARCMFWAYKHNPVGLAPNKKEQPEDWTVVELPSDKRIYINARISKTESR